MHLISLARNRQVVSYGETDCEKINMAMKLWKEASSKSQGEATDLSNLLPETLASFNDNRLVALLEDPCFSELLHVQHNTPITWEVSSQWKVAWLSRLLGSPSGGVCGLLSGVNWSLLMPFVEHTAYCTGGASHVSLPRPPYFLRRALYK